MSCLSFRKCRSTSNLRSIVINISRQIAFKCFFLANRPHLWLCPRVSDRYSNTLLSTGDVLMLHGQAFRRSIKGHSWRTPIITWHFRQQPKECLQTSEQTKTDSKYPANYILNCPNIYNYSFKTQENPISHQKKQMSACECVFNTCS